MGLSPRAVGNAQWQLENTTGYGFIVSTCFHVTWSFGSWVLGRLSEGISRNGKGMAIFFQVSFDKKPPQLSEGFSLRGQHQTLKPKRILKQLAIPDGTFAAVPALCDARV